MKENFEATNFSKQKLHNIKDKLASVFPKFIMHLDFAEKSLLLSKLIIYDYSVER